MTFKRILVGLDGSDLAETVLEPVRNLAAPLGARVDLLHVTPVPTDVHPRAGTALDEALALERARARTYLDRVMSRLPREVAGKTAVRAGDPATEIVHYATREDVDLIALGTHGRSGMSRWLYGSVAEAVLHTTTKPLLLLRPGDDAGLAAEPQVRRILVPLDGSAFAQAALPVAEELAGASRIPIVLLRTVDFVPLAFSSDPYGGAVIDFKAIIDALRVDAECHLAAVATPLRARGLRVETSVTFGTPVDAITTATGEHPGTLVVMTTHGRTGLRRMLLGSSARRVALLTHGPVLLVRPEDSRSRPDDVVKKDAMFPAVM